MAKIINPDTHCSECEYYEPCTNCKMYCKYCRGYKYMYGKCTTNEGASKKEP